MPRNDLVDLLLLKADQDLYVLEKLLPDALAPVEIFGFHAQQAAEKLIKAVLSLHTIEYGRTHRLAELVDIANDQGVRFPANVEFLVDLTPYAVEFRYDMAPEEGHDELDKDETIEILRSFRSWVLEQAGR